MAEITTKRISELPAAESVGSTDLLAMEQGGTAKKVSASLLLASAGGAVFVTYDTSTFEEIETAYNDGKAVYAVSGDYAYPLTMFDGDNAEFTGYSSEGCVKITCDSTDVWGKLVTSYMANVTFAQRGQFLRYNGFNWSAYTITKTDVSLENVDNTSDLAKPVSTATQTALDAKVSKPSSPTVGDVLTWDGSAWVASAPTGGSSGVLGVTQDSDGYLVLSPVSAVSEETVADDGAVTKALDADKICHFTGDLTALTITLNAPQTGMIAHYHFDFLSGSTAPTLTLPSSVVMPDSFSVEANKRYEVDILNNYGAVMSWAIS